MLSLPHLLLLLVIVLLLFGRGRVTHVMGDLGKGIRALREGLKEETPPPPPISRATTIDQPPVSPNTVSQNDPTPRV